MSGVRENLSYEQFGVAVRELAQTIADDGYRPDVVLSIARGGVFVAGGLAYALGTGRCSTPEGDGGAQKHRLGH